MQHDVVIPMLEPTWCTRAVIEGLFHHYRPRRVHVIAPADGCETLRRVVSDERWSIGEWQVHEEESFFSSPGSSKAELGRLVDTSRSLYSPGWFYQQLLKLGAWDGIEGLSESYLVWDADLLPIETWPVLDAEGRPIYALLQHNSRGNPDIVGRWASWIREVLGVEPIEDDAATFVPHHMWFERSSLIAMMDRLAVYYDSDEPWPVLMMRSANDFGTFSEYWLYASWLASRSPDEPRCYPYSAYGETTERFFDNGTGPFSGAMRERGAWAGDRSPSYAEVAAFVEVVYAGGPLPSSIAFEQSPRHIKKNKANMHLEEVRSRWHAATLDLDLDL
ncbi:MAG: DUF6492 family protein [Phycisphaeraceae bacterium]